jgi:hypothetical protein
MPAFHRLVGQKLEQGQQVRGSFSQFYSQAVKPNEPVTDADKERSNCKNVGQHLRDAARVGWVEEPVWPPSIDISADDAEDYPSYWEYRYPQC